MAWYNFFKKKGAKKVAESFVEGNVKKLSSMIRDASKNLRAGFYDDYFENYAEQNKKHGKSMIYEEGYSEKYAKLAEYLAKGKYKEEYKEIIDDLRTLSVMFKARLDQIRTEGPSSYVMSYLDEHIENCDKEQLYTSTESDKRKVFMGSKPRDLETISSERDAVYIGNNDLCITDYGTLSRSALARLRRPEYEELTFMQKTVGTMSKAASVAVSLMPWFYHARDKLIR